MISQCPKSNIPSISKFALALPGGIHASAGRSDSGTHRLGLAGNMSTSRRNMRIVDGILEAG